MNKRSANEWMRDVELSQRNIVFPDTLRNEMKGWRSLITSKKPLSVLQVVALLVLYLSVLSTLFLTGYGAFEIFHKTSGTGVSRVVAAFGPFVTIAVLCGAVLLLLRWRVRKALAGADKRPPLPK